MPLRDATVAIVGLGLMGGSLGLALEGRCALRMGVARRARTAEEALRRGAVDRAGVSLGEAVRDADVVVLAAPVCAILSMMDEARANMRPGALLTDVGSTKGEIVAAMSALQGGIAAVGGHPMCGKENGGLGEAESTLYHGAAYVLCPTAHTTPESLALMHEMVEAIGARALVMEANRHDRAAAYISHLPYMLAASLVHAEAKAADGDPEISKLAAGGFRDTTRVAASEREMMLDTLLTNRACIEEALDGFERQIAAARELLGDPDALGAWIEGARAKRRAVFP